jgi:molybdopterin molybdotransferase
MVLNLIGEIRAGDAPNIIVRENEAVRIFTGAALPEGTNTVVMQEYVEKNESMIYMNELPGLGSNVRLKGGQIKEGDLALRKGTTLSPAAIGFLASLGISSVSVNTKPSVGIIVTGNEFLENNEDVKDGKIFESNGLMLQKILEMINIKAQYKTCEDDKMKLLSLAKTVTDVNEISIITGGVSVGDYDYTENILSDLGFEIIFHDVSQKPGKPLLFAKKGDKAAFGLPGNPRSVLVCYYEYIYPYIRASMGALKPFLTSVHLPLIDSYEKTNERSTFLTAEAGTIGVTINEGQDSHMLKSFSDANSLILLPEGTKKYKSGDIVEVHILS